MKIFTLPRVNLKKLDSNKNNSKYSNKTNSIKTDVFNKVSFGNALNKHITESFFKRVIKSPEISEELLQNILKSKGDDLKKPVEQFINHIDDLFSEVSAQERKKLGPAYQFWNGLSEHTSPSSKDSFFDILKNKLKLEDIENSLKSHLEIFIKKEAKPVREEASQNIQKIGATVANEVKSISEPASEIVQKTEEKVIETAKTFTTGPRKKQLTPEGKKLPKFSTNIKTTGIKVKLSGSTPKPPSTVSTSANEGLSKFSGQRTKKTISKQGDRIPPSIREGDSQILKRDLQYYKGEELRITDELDELKPEFEKSREERENIVGFLKRLRNHPILKKEQEKLKLESKIEDFALTIKEHTEKDYKKLLEKHLQNKPTKPQYDETAYKTYKDEVRTWAQELKQLRDKQTDINKSGKSTKLDKKDAQRAVSYKEANRPVFVTEKTTGSKADNIEPWNDAEALKEIEGYEEKILSWEKLGKTLEKKVKITENLKKTKEQKRKLEEKSEALSKHYPYLDDITQELTSIEKQLEAKTVISEKIKLFESRLSTFTEPETNLAKLESELEIANIRKLLLDEQRFNTSLDKLKKQKSKTNKYYSSQISQKEEEVNTLKSQLIPEEENSSLINLKEFGITQEEIQEFRQNIRTSYERNREIQPLKNSINNYQDDIKSLYTAIERKVDKKPLLEINKLIATKQKLEKNIEIAKDGLSKLKNPDGITPIAVNENKEAIHFALEESIIKNKRSLDKLNTKLKSRLTENNVNHLYQRILQKEENILSTKKEIAVLENLKPKTPKNIKEKLTPKEIENYANQTLLKLTDNNKQVSSQVHSLESDIAKLKLEQESKINTITARISSLKETQDKTTKISDSLDEGTQKEILKQAKLLQRKASLEKKKKSIVAKLTHWQTAKKDVSEIEKAQKEIKTQLNIVKEQLSHYKHISTRSIAKIEEDMSHQLSLVQKQTSKTEYNEQLTQKIEQQKQMAAEYARINLPIYSKQSVEKQQIRIFEEYLGIALPVKGLDQLLPKRLSRKLKINKLNSYINYPSKHKLPPEVVSKLKSVDTKHLVENIQLEVLSNYFNIEPGALKHLDNKLSTKAQVKMISKLKIKLKKEESITTLRDVLQKYRKSLPDNIQKNLKINTQKEYLIYRQEQLNLKKQSILNLNREIESTEQKLQTALNEESKLKGQIDSLTREKEKYSNDIYDVEEQLGLHFQM